jgi:hypothetical protein
LADVAWMPTGRFLVVVMAGTSPAMAFGKKEPPGA